MSVTSPRDEYEALVYALERLTRRFPDVPEDTIVRLIAAELAAFDRARFRQYIPVLVEGRVHRMLSEAGRRDRAGTLRAS